MSNAPKTYIAPFNFTQSPVFTDDDESSDNASKLLNLFKKRNNKLKKLFHCSNESSVEQVSYHLRLITPTKDSNGDNKEDEANQEENTEKENELVQSSSCIDSNSSLPPKRRLSSHVENLPPVEVIELSSEEVNEPLSLAFKSPKDLLKNDVAPTSSVRPLANKSLRRSLFGFNPENISTPLRSHPLKNTWLLDTPSKVISPIDPPSTNSTIQQSNQAEEQQPELLEEIPVVSSSQNEKELAPVLITEVQSIAQIENDLQIQYGLSDISIPQRQTRNVENQLVTSSTPKTNPPSKTLVGDVEMDVEQLSMTHSGMGSAKKMQNKTDMDSVKMMETIVGKLNPSTPFVNKQLYVMLRRCDETSDELMDVEPDNLRLDKNTQSFRKPKNVEISRSSRARNKSVSYSTTSSFRSKAFRSGSEKRRTTSYARSTPDEQAPLELNLSISKVLPDEVLDSFRSLPKRKTAEEKSSLEVQKGPIKINAPKKNSRISTIASSTQSYLDLTGKRARSSSRSDSTMGKKKTLYSDSSPDENSPPNARKTRTSKVFKPPPPQCNEIGSTDLSIEIPCSQPPDNLLEEIPSDHEEMEQAERPQQAKTAKTAKKTANKKTKPSRQKKQQKKSKVIDSDWQEKGANKATNEKRAKSKKVPEEPSDSNRDSSPESSDEGIASESDQNSRDDILYDPAERGCQRQGLRVRRIAHPYWINNKDKEKYGYTHAALTNQGFKAEGKWKDAMQNASRVDSRLMNAISDNLFLKAEERVKLIQKRKPQEKILTKKSQKVKKARKAESVESTEVVEAASEVQATSSNASSQPPVSNASIERNLANIIQSIREGKTLDDNVAERSAQHEGFDYSNLGSVEYQDCRNGVYFGRYITEKSDGIIKIIPGGCKPQAKSKHSLLKFLCLHGNVKFTVNQEVVELKLFDYISIKPMNYYKVENVSDDDTILYFTRFDRPTASPDHNLSSSSGLGS